MSNQIVPQLSPLKEMQRCLNSEGDFANAVNLVRSRGGRESVGGTMASYFWNAERFLYIHWHVQGSVSTQVVGAAVDNLACSNAYLALRALKLLGSINSRPLQPKM